MTKVLISFWINDFTKIQRLLRTYNFFSTHCSKMSSEQRDFGSGGGNLITRLRVYRERLLFSMDYNLVIKFVAAHALLHSRLCFVLPLIIFHRYYAATRLSLIARIIILYFRESSSRLFIHPWKSKFWVIVRRWIANRGAM